MRVKVECHCGWRRELSGFYAGKRIRCADCQAVLDVPGNNDNGAYLYPPMRSWRSGRHVKPQGEWRTVRRVPGQPAGQASQAAGYKPSVPRMLILLGLALAPIGLILAPTEIPDCQERREPSFQDLYPSGRIPEMPPSSPDEEEDDKPTDDDHAPDDDFETEKVDEF